MTRTKPCKPFASFAVLVAVAVVVAQAPNEERTLQQLTKINSAWSLTEVKLNCRLNTRVTFLTALVPLCFQYC